MSRVPLKKNYIEYNVIYTHFYLAVLHTHLLDSWVRQYIDAIIGVHTIRTAKLVLNAAINICAIKPTANWYQFWLLHIALLLFCSIIHQYIKKIFIAIIFIVLSHNFTFYILIQKYKLFFSEESIHYIKIYPFLI